MASQLELYIGIPIDNVDNVGNDLIIRHNLARRFALRCRKFVKTFSEVEVVSRQWFLCVSWRVSE